MSHLVYVADIPKAAGTPGEDLGWIDVDPHIVVDVHGRFALDNNWWLAAGDGPTFPDDVQEYLRTFPRRFATRATLRAPARRCLGEDPDHSDCW